MTFCILSTVRILRPFLPFKLECLSGRCLVMGPHRLPPSPEYAGGREDGGRPKETDGRKRGWRSFGGPLVVWDSGEG